MAVKQEDILKGKACPKGYEEDLQKLIKRLNRLEEEWEEDFVITSGLRSIADQIRIYAKKGITDKSKIPFKSKHFYCQAADIEDKDGSLYEWLLKNERLLENIGLWMELNTKGWVHLQTKPPGSNRRYFLP